MLQRLNKRLAAAGVVSRRSADLIIQEGRVKVNGKVCTTLGTKVEDTDQVKLDGKILESQQPVVYAVYKPKGYICSQVAQDHRPLVGDLVPKNPLVYPAGRLDAESEGLIILTNDGSLTAELLHPSKGHLKRYSVIVKPEVIPANFDENVLSQIKLKLEKGVKLSDGKATGTEVVLSMGSDDTIRLELSVQEGRHHLVRRMCATLGLKVLKLIRVQIGEYSLGQMKSGRFKKLYPNQIKQLLR